MIYGFQRDEVNIETAESRSKMYMADQPTRINVGPGHIVKLSNFSGSSPKSLQKLLKKDPSVGAYINSITAGAVVTGNNAEDNA